MKLVTQPTWNSCTSSCLSMLTGIPVWDIIDAFHLPWMTSQTNPYEFLDSHSIDYEKPEHSYTGVLYEGNNYLLTVPSLNIVGGLHHIVFTGEGRVLDPNNGVPDRKYYVDIDGPVTSDDEVKLKSWVIDLWTT